VFPRRRLATWLGFGSFDFCLSKLFGPESFYYRLYTNPPEPLNGHMNMKFGFASDATLPNFKQLNSHRPQKS
jgi:hypothetical protein